MAHSDRDRCDASLTVRKLTLHDCLLNITKLWTVRAMSIYFLFFFLSVSLFLYPWHLMHACVRVLGCVHVKLNLFQYAHTAIYNILNVSSEILWLNAYEYSISRLTSFATHSRTIESVEQKYAHATHEINDISMRYAIGHFSPFDFHIFI